MLRRSLLEDVSISKELTETGCECLVEWKALGHIPCETSCCSPDGDEKFWCLVKPSQSCDLSWDYCENQDFLPTSFENEVSYFEQSNNTTGEGTNPSTEVTKPSNPTSTLFYVIIVLALLFILVLSILLLTPSRKNKPTDKKRKSKRKNLQKENEKKKEVVVQVDIEEQGKEKHESVELKTRVEEDLQVRVEQPTESQIICEELEVDVLKAADIEVEVMIETESNLKKITVFKDRGMEDVKLLLDEIITKIEREDKLDPKTLIENEQRQEQPNLATKIFNYFFTPEKEQHKTEIIT
eukprot:augustus_masked-scaffold_2-processed-gene-5.60-mRNA-1 protein AED:1.00 eAED:1.00 QI:0/-1/0/0/-1/1/1/0/295